MEEQKIPQTPEENAAVPQTPPAAEYTPAPQPQTPPEQPQTPPAAPEYRPQGGYSPYGYQPNYSQGGYTPPVYQQPSAPPQPPRRKGTGWLVTLLCVVCAVSILITAFAVALSKGWISLPQMNNSTKPLSSGGTKSTVNSNAPQIEITSTVESNNWASQAIQQVLPSTVILYVYSGSSRAGVATGVIYSQDGYIITNAHCVYNSDAGRQYDYFDVELYDGTIYENARVCGYDTSTDLAVIKVEASGLTPATFGNADDMVLGDYVVALGNISGLTWSASMGILSGLNRYGSSDDGYAIPFLQVDAAINPGNSGGPLFNAAGQVIGINSRKIILDGYENLGFAIPINAESKVIIDSLAYAGKVMGRVALGVKGQEVTTLNYEGYYISQISTSSPLYDQVAAGDIIQYVDGVRVKSYSAMRAELVKHKVGDTVTLTLLHIERRTGRETTYEVTVTLKDETEIVW